MQTNFRSLGGNIAPASASNSGSLHGFNVAKGRVVSAKPTPGRQLRQQNITN